jgi:hypothetical protein
MGMTFHIDEILSKEVDPKPEKETIEETSDFMDNEVEEREDFYEDSFEEDDDDQDPPEELDDREDLSDIVDPEESAEFLIDAYDTAQQFLLPIIYERAAFTKTERQELKQLARQYKHAKREKEKLSLDERQQNLLIMWTEAEEYEENIVPLDDKEIRKLKKPLISVLRRSNFKTSPGTALIIAAAMTVFPRLIPLMDLSKEKKRRS